MPAGLEAIHAVVTGAGGGALVARGNSGYAGSGGDVKYRDITNEVVGSVLEGVVGQGGTSGTTPTGGGSSALFVGVGGLGADGGVAGDELNQYCVPNGSYSVYVGNGNGAGGPAGENEADCATSTAPGIVPSSDPDVDDNAPLSLFADFDLELGAGGRVIVPAIAPSSASLTSGTGKGADVEYIDPEVPNWDAVGDDGSVIIRYPVAASAPEPELDDELDAELESAPELAETGAAEAAPLAGLAALLLGLGTAAVAVSRRRAQKN